jgi:hypothetical protein
MPVSGPNDLNPPPPHARGADLSLIPKAADVPAADLKKLLGVDSANPFLRALRIERGFLKASDLPRELSRAVPLDSAALAKLREEEK